MLRKLTAIFSIVLLILLSACTEKPNNSSLDNNSSETVSTNVNLQLDEIRPEGNTSTLRNPQVGGADAEAETMRNAILNAEDNLKISGVTYYISPSGDDYNSGTSPEDAWQTPEAIIINDWNLKDGDGILFERGGIYRFQGSILLNKELMIGAYGKGDKPAIYGSSKNYANNTDWQPSRKKNIWKLSVSCDDIGNIVFNHGEATGEKKYGGLLDLEKNGDFYHNLDEHYLYLYLDTGYPDEVYKDIEICSRGNLFMINGKVNNVTIDNLCIKYVGSHGIGTVGNNSNITITNCEIGWIGGCQQVNSDEGVRYGNGIQFWSAAYDVRVENNWVYQCYDTGITFQGRDTEYLNHVYKNNLMEYNSYNFEFFNASSTSTATTKGIIKNVVIEDNIMRFAGYGWGEQRMQPMGVAHITTWGYEYLNENIDQFIFKNNIFDSSARNVIYWAGQEGNTTKYDGLIIENNTFYQKINSEGYAMHFRGGPKAGVTASNESQLITAIKTFDKNPKSVTVLK